MFLTCIFLLTLAYAFAKSKEVTGYKMYAGRLSLKTKRYLCKSIVRADDIRMTPLFIRVVGLKFPRYQSQILYEPSNNLLPTFDCYENFNPNNGLT